MQRIFGLIKDKTEKLLADGTVNRVIGWKKGELFYDNTPAVFNISTVPGTTLTGDEMESFVYDGFCASNLSKYLISESKKDGKILALLKPCDTYCFNQLAKEHRINKDNVYILGIECRGMIDINKIKDLGIKGIISIEEKDYEYEKYDQLIIQTIYGEKTCKKREVLLEKCLCCKGKRHVTYDELLSRGDHTPEDTRADIRVLTGENTPEVTPEVTHEDTSKDIRKGTPEATRKKASQLDSNRFELVEKLEAMTPDERFSFWRGELSKCIRCNACRNVCPACSCIKCVFDNDNSGIASKANTDTFEENMFHIIRAFHVAGRCTDCGECSRVCPQHIPLHLLNRKIIKDINELYGEYQAGADTESRAPLADFTKEDVEPSIVAKKGGEH